MYKRSISDSIKSKYVTLADLLTGNYFEINALYTATLTQTLNFHLGLFTFTNVKSKFEEYKQP